MSTACVVIVKNCEAIIAEWLAYQLALGFETILLFDNASSDLTLNIVQKFQQKYDVRVIPWPFTSKTFQDDAYKYALFKFKREFSWLAFIDSDEFLTLPPGRTLKNLLDVPGDVAAIALPWAFFGSSGLVSRPKDFVIKSYLYRAENTFDPNTIIKSIVRPERVVRVYGPHNFGVKGAYVSINHAPISRPDWRMQEPPNYQGGKLHHYFVQSREDWARKILRGFHGAQRSADEFDCYDRNEVYDDDALRLLARVEEILASTASENVKLRVNPPAYWDRQKARLFFYLHHKPGRIWASLKKRLPRR